LLNKFFYLLTAAYGLIAFCSCGGNSLEKKTNSARNIFENNCADCHGSDGKLGALGAKDLSLSLLDKKQMAEIIANGKNNMTPFGTLLSPAEIDSVVAYIQTFKK
jgi:cytochrome c6